MTQRTQKDNERVGEADTGKKKVSGWCWMDGWRMGKRGWEKEEEGGDCSYYTDIYYLLHTII